MSFQSASLLAILALSPTASADVFVAGPSGGASAIQNAVDLASSGDVILVQPGTYNGVSIIDKGVSIIADGAPVPLIIGTVRVSGLPVGEVFELNGFRVNSRLFSGTEEAFFARNCSGSLLVENCTFISDHGVPGMEGNLFPGRSGVRLVNVSASTWNRCSAFGGRGANLSDENSEFGVGRGGHGFEFGDGDHALFDCIGVGNDGGTVFDTEDIDGGDGGSGAKFGNFGFASGCTLTGGEGGDGECQFVFCASAGDGGDGIEFGSFPGVSQVWTIDNTYFPGDAGTYPTPGSDGVDVRTYTGNTHLDFTDRAKGLEVTTPLRVFEPGTLKVRGEANELALLFFSLNLDVTPNLALNGLFAPALPLNFINLGLIPESGEKTLNLTPQPIGGLESVSINLQAVIFDGGTGFVSGASRLTIVDAMF